MKELTIEEKARAYDKAINAIKELKEKHPTALVIKDWIKENFPELAESEDENIRKRLVDYFADFHLQTFAGIDPKKIIVWVEKQANNDDFLNNIQIGDKVTRNEDGVLVNLSQLKRVAKKDEKQSEQKPADNEPTFHKGDWIINNEHNNVAKVFKVLEDNYRLDFGKDTIGTLCTELVDNDYRLWDITKDAKDGDVLACGENGWTCIFKALNNSNISFSSYCFMDKDGWFYGTGSECHTLEKSFIKAYIGNIHPATKEQCDLLFQKMKEAGYEWDSEKKELKKVEQKLADKEESLSDMEKYILNFADYFYSNRCKPESKWIDEIKMLRDYIPSHILKSAWNEEVDLDKEINAHWDEWAKENGFHFIDFAKHFFELGLNARKDELYGITRSDRHWTFTSYSNALKTLYEQLKKLRE